MLFRIWSRGTEMSQPKSNASQAASRPQGQPMNERRLCRSKCPFSAWLHKSKLSHGDRPGGRHARVSASVLGILLQSLALHHRLYLPPLFIACTPRNAEHFRINPPSYCRPPFSNHCICNSIEMRLFLSPLDQLLAVLELTSISRKRVT